MYLITSIPYAQKSIPYATETHQKVLKVGAFLTCVGYATMDTEGRVVLAFGAGPCYLTTETLGSLVSKLYSSASSKKMWSQVCMVVAGALVGAQLYAWARKLLRRQKE